VIDPNPQDVLSQLDQVGSLIWSGGDICPNSFVGLEDAIWWLGREMRGRGSTEKGQARMSSEGQRIWNIKSDGQHHHSSPQVHPLMILWNFWNNHPNSALTHTAWGSRYPTPLKSSHQTKSSFHYIYFFPDESLCFALITIFLLIYHLTSSCCSEMELMDISLTHWWALLKPRSLLIIHDSSCI